MAGKAFRRLLEIALDKASARKTERDTQDSLRRATDPGVIQKSMDRVGNVIQRSARVFLQAGAAVAGYALSIAKLTERGGQVINVQRAFARVTGDADAAVGKLRKATGGLIADFDLMVGFNRAFSLGAVKTVDQFGEMASVARDLGRALGVDAAYAMEQLSLGIARHSPKILDNLGITAKAGDDFATIMEKARKRVDELGVSGANTADTLVRLKTQFRNFVDEVSKFLARSDTLNVAFFEVANVLETMVQAMQTGDIEIVKEVFGHIGTILGTTFAQSFMEAVKSTLQKVSADNPVLLSALGLAGGFAAGAVTGGAVGAIAGGGVGMFPGALIGGVIGGIAGANRPGMTFLEAQAAKLLEAADDKSKEIEETINAEFEALNALGRRIQGLLDERGAKNPPGPGTGAGTGDGAAAAEGLRGNAGFEARREEIHNQARSLLGVPISPKFAKPGSDRLSDDFQNLVDFYRTGFDDIANAGQIAALGIEDAFSRAFQLLGKEGTTAGTILEEIFRGVAASGLIALAQYATSKVTEDVAHAFDEFAAATASAALFDPVSAALHTKAAHGYLLGAAKWALAGGAASAAAAAVGGGGAGGFRGNDVVGREVDKLDHAAPVVNIYVDGIDPDNPAHVALMQRTVVNAREQWGDQKPTVRRYSRTTA